MPVYRSYRTHKFENLILKAFEHNQVPHSRHVCNFRYKYCRAYVWRLYKTGIGLTTGFIGSHTVTHNYSVYALQLTAVHYHTC
jgi:hypothetical protein